ncbi:MAG: Phosphate regulon transcriptional regulatory protein [Gammaproteobacteria bacterium]|nr:MAG: Phosphate regulon transcriptional regulatory protein [Gammaproteobacteria bacterium]TND06617.1 MAG: Phosphate regulon transcriptional regulatory protein [Gammaproteobacteria bacterium]
MAATVLIVEDEPAICEMVGFALSRSGYDYHAAMDVEQAHRIIMEQRPDLILLDWMLPGESGLQFARRLKKDSYTREIPIIMLTARGEEGDKVSGLEAGADDYITKPFSPKELMARIKAVLRRVAPHAANELVRAGALLLDPGTHRVMSDDNELRVGPTEFRLLNFLMTHPEHVFSRAQLLDNVWGTGVFIDERTVDVHIRRLRESLTPAGCEKMIQTVRGVGYRFSTQEPS